jgi:hypothetical protein
MRKNSSLPGQENFSSLRTWDCNFGWTRMWGFLGETNKPPYILESKFRIFTLLYFIPYRLFVVVDREYRRTTIMFFGSYTMYYRICRE